jgi:hypothetical protein
MARLPRPPLEYRDVQVYDASEDTKVISGGFLSCQEAWLPSGLVDSDGEKFVPISKLDRRLRTFAGIALKFNEYIDDLMEARNSVCEQILKTLANDSEAVVPKDVDKKLSVTVAKKRLSMQAPKTVFVKMPVKGDPSITADIKVLFESDFKVSVAVLVDATVLSHVCLGIHHSAQGERGKKRTLDNRVKFNYKEVRFNSSRGQPLSSTWMLMEGGTPMTNTFLWMRGTRQRMSSLRWMRLRNTCTTIMLRTTILW